MEAFRAFKAALLDRLRQIASLVARFQKGADAIETLMADKEREWEKRVARTEDGIARIQQAMAMALRNSAQEAAMRDRSSLASSQISAVREADARTLEELAQLRQSLENERKQVLATAEQLADAMNENSTVVLKLQGLKNHIATFQARSITPLKVILDDPQSGQAVKAIKYLEGYISRLNVPQPSSASTTPSKPASGLVSGASSSSDALEAKISSLKLLLASREKLIELLLSKLEELVDNGAIHNEVAIEAIRAARK